MGSEGSSPSGSAIWKVGRVWLIAPVLRTGRDIVLTEVRILYLPLVIKGYVMAKRKEKRPWYVSEKCPECGKRLLYDGNKVYCNCGKEWFSIEDLKEELYE